MTKENIIIAALRLFLMRGYKSVSLIDVANEVGITKGGIYHYFSSKDDLLHVSLHLLVDRFEATYRDIFSEQNTIKTVLHSLIVERSVENYFKDLLQVTESCTLDYAHFVIEVMSKFPDIKQRIEQNSLIVCESLSQKIQRAMEKGELKSGFDSFALAAV
ncbi:MAG: transcriptional repressor BetI, partial [Anaerosporomusa subterranea]|nr:transcriptional repressor BetI [Anaerosporomusa subterranea]